ncbi:hypothetical protein IAU60_002833 [Kwoniella sp. DSM 27419]
MRFSDIILPALTLSATAVSVAGLHINHVGGTRRSPAHVNLGAKRGAAVLFPANDKVKRVVKKKKKRGSCQVKFNATSVVTSPSTEASATSSSTIGWTNATASLTATETATGTASATTSASGATRPTSSSSWLKVEEYSGSNFFDESNWNFWSWDDPTHGTVQYLDREDAWNSGLISINGAGNAIMAVDTTEVVQGGRKSIRIHGNQIFTGGLVLMDAVHMPTGCGVWPAFWSNSVDNWPNGGEIDILEGVNDFTDNQVSLHTRVGCSLPSDTNSNQVGALTTGNFNSYDCSSYNTGNQGCGVRDEVTQNAYGASFNANKGGVYAMRWTKAGITVWFFPRNAIPADITNETPDPSIWGTPMANFPGTDCDPYSYFYDHFSIFDTTLCGDWSGNVWNQAGYAGQDQSCADKTGYATCSDYVLNKGSAFTEATWEISYVKYFNSTTEV